MGGLGEGAWEDAPPNLTLVSSVQPPAGRGPGLPLVIHSRGWGLSEDQGVPLEPGSSSDAGQCPPGLAHWRMLPRPPRLPCPRKSRRRGPQRVGVRVHQKGRVCVNVCRHGSVTVCKCVSVLVSAPGCSLHLPDMGNMQCHTCVR